MKNKALFVGLTTIDIQFFVDKYPIPNTKNKTEMPLVQSGGPSANAAVTFSFLGGSADFLSCVGENSFSPLISADFKKNDVKLYDCMQGEKNDPIISAVITTVGNSDRTILTHHPKRLSHVNIKNVIDLKRYQFVFVDGFYPELAIPICEEAVQLGIPVIFDGGSWKKHLPELLKYVTIAICSANFIPPNCNTKHDVFKYLEKLNVEFMAISRGAKDIYTPNQRIGIEEVDAIDSLGAGDILHGAFCWFWSQKQDFAQALLASSEVATFSTKFKGTRDWMLHY